jgi:hypothetical protein
MASSSGMALLLVVFMLSGVMYVLIGFEFILN